MLILICGVLGAVAGGFFGYRLERKPHEPIDGRAVALIAVGGLLGLFLGLFIETLLETF